MKSERKHHVPSQQVTCHTHVLYVASFTPFRCLSAERAQTVVTVGLTNWALTNWALTYTLGHYHAMIGGGRQMRCKHCKSHLVFVANVRIS